jgi:hypothetical protein
MFFNAINQCAVSLDEAATAGRQTTLEMDERAKRSRYG